MRDSLLTAATLSVWLHRSGTLACGAVAEVRVELEFKTTISKLVFLAVTYSDDAPANLPHHLVKSPLVGATREDYSHGELQFYHEINMPELPVKHIRAGAASSNCNCSGTLDYRRCVVRNLTVPIIFWSRGMKPEGWCTALSVPWRHTMILGANNYCNDSPIRSGRQQNGGMGCEFESGALVLVREYAGRAAPQSVGFASH